MLWQAIARVRLRSRGCPARRRPPCQVNAAWRKAARGQPASTSPGLARRLGVARPGVGQTREAAEGEGSKRSATTHSVEARVLLAHALEPMAAEGAVGARGAAYGTGRGRERYHTQSKVEAEAACMAGALARLGKGIRSNNSGCEDCGGRDVHEEVEHVPARRSQADVCAQSTCCLAEAYRRSGRQVPRKRSSRPTFCWRDQVGGTGG